MKRPRLLPVAAVGAFWSSAAWGYPAIMLQPQHCDSALAEGTSIMGAAAVQSTEPPPLRVTRGGGSTLASGDKYTSGDYLQFSYTGKGQFLLEVDGKAIWNGGGCGDRRIATDPAGLGMPMGEDLPDIQVKVAYASKFGKVTLTQPFILKSPLSKRAVADNTTAGATAPGASTTTPAATPAPTKGKDEFNAGIVAKDTLKEVTVLNPDEKVVLSYEVSPDRDYVDVQVNAPANSWVAVGVVKDGDVQMVVADDPHKVLVYPYSDGEARLVSLKSTRAAAITPVEMNPAVYKVLQAESTADGVLLRYRMFADKGGGGLLKLTESNTVMWAHTKGAWPAMHTSSDGVVVNWSLGQVTAAQAAADAFLFPGQILLLLPLLAVPLLWTPLRRTLFGKALLNKRIAQSISSIPFSYHTKIWNSIASFKVGESFMVIIYLLCHLGLMLHWYYATLPHVGNTPAYAATTATGYGGLTNLMMVTLPISKTTLWVRLLGISFDRAVKFHRVLARYTLVTMATHFAIASDVYWFNFTSTGDLAVVTGWGFLALCIFIFISLTAIDMVRRRLYETFKSLHYLSYLGVAAVTLHLPAPAFGIPYFLPLTYLGFPVLLYVIDQCLRFARVAGTSATAVELKALTDGATKLQVSVSEQQPDGGGDDSGSYYFIQIPSISRVEWHPYSVCADGGADPSVLTFIIKDNGKRTWSGAVYRLAKKLATQKQKQQQQQSSSSQNGNSSHHAAAVRVRLDGPYGNLSVNIHEDYDRILLVGGGVGITPLTSTIRHIAQELQGGRLGHVRLVELVWVVKTVAQLSWFEGLLLEIQEAAAGGDDLSTIKPTMGTTAGGSSGGDDERKEAVNEDRSGGGAATTGGFRLRLYVTGAQKGDVTEAGLRYAAGRPDLDGLVDKFAISPLSSSFSKKKQQQQSQEAAGGQSGGGGAVIACGPDGMLAELRNAAGRHHLALHEEVFQW